MQFSDVFSLSLRTVRGNRLRTGITVAIIAFGIMALIGIITAIDAMNKSIYENFTLLGSNTFSIRFRERQISFGNNNGDVKKTSKKDAAKQKKSNLGKVITYREAEDFKSRFHFPAIVSVSQNGTGSARIFYGERKTNPTVRVLGGDENYLASSGYLVATGRNFSQLDVQSGRAVALLGMDVATKLFGDQWKQVAVGSTVRIGSNPYLVIGVLAAKGASSFLSLDNIVITTLNNVRQVYNSSNSYNLSVTVNDVKQMDAAIGEATGLMRNVRGLDVKESENFFIDRSDSLANELKNVLSFVALAAGAIGFITLIGAAIGLMNIMLVAVSERTREIGLVKSLGATKQTIRLQFLMESVLISLFGAIFGIILGVMVGNTFAIFLKTGFVVPWGWVAGGIFICSLTGLAAGLYPAVKAARLDPIVALRYE